MNEIKYIRSRLSEPELLAQLAEEAAELAQAALKLRRVLVGVNPTPVGEEAARERLTEESTDVFLCLATLDATFNVGIMDEKQTRWAERLKGVECNG